jgi:hypothetical protein
MGMNNEFNYRWDNPVQIRTCPVSARTRSVYWYNMLAA